MGLVGLNIPHKPYLRLLSSGVWRAQCLRRGKARLRRLGEDVVGVTAITTSPPPPTATRVDCANVPGSVRCFCLTRCVCSNCADFLAKIECADFEEFFCTKCFHVLPRRYPPSSSSSSSLIVISCPLSLLSLLLNLPRRPCPAISRCPASS